MANDQSNKNNNEPQVGDKKASKWESFQTVENRDDDDSNSSDKENFGAIAILKNYILPHIEEFCFLFLYYYCEKINI